MTEVLRKSGSRIFEIVFFASAPLSLWIIICFVFEGIIEEELPLIYSLSKSMVYILLLIILYVVTWFVFRAIKSKWNALFMTQPGFRSWEAVIPIVKWALVSYILLGILFGALAFIFVPTTDGEKGLVIWGAAVWLPLWFVLPIGSSVAWAHYRKLVSR